MIPTTYTEQQQFLEQIKEAVKQGVIDGTIELQRMKRRKGLTVGKKSFISKTAAYKRIGSRSRVDRLLESFPQHIATRRTGNAKNSTILVCLEDLLKYDQRINKP